MSIHDDANAASNNGALVAVDHLGSPGGPVATAGCSPPSNGLCGHLLVALAGTEECR